MQQEIQKYLKLLFPKYESSSYSRFIKLFQEIENKNENVCEKQFLTNKSLNINISKIKNGEEKRTSIIIKYIPSLLGSKNFYDLLKTFTKRINFFYIPGYISDHKEYMYAFVNLSNNKEIIDIVDGLNTLKNKFETYRGLDFRYLEIYFSKTQGYKALKKKYKNDYYNDFIIS